MFLVGFYGFLRCRGRDFCYTAQILYGLFSPYPVICVIHITGYFLKRGTNVVHFSGRKMHGLKASQLTQSLSLWSAPQANAPIYNQFLRYGLTIYQRHPTSFLRFRQSHSVQNRLKCSDVSMPFNFFIHITPRGHWLPHGSYFRFMAQAVGEKPSG